MHNIRGVLLRQAIFWRQRSACVLQKSRRLFSDLSSDFIAAASFIIRRSLVYLLHRSFWPVDMPREVFFFCSLFLVVVSSFARVANPFCINVFSYILGGLMSAVCCPVGSPLKEPFGKGKGWDIPDFVVWVDRHYCYSPLSLQHVLVTCYLEFSLISYLVFWIAYPAPAQKWKVNNCNCKYSKLVPALVVLQGRLKTVNKLD